MRKQIYKVLQGIFIVILSLTATAKDYPLRHYTVADGLPSNEVYHVFQDSKGYIWFGTDNGVARYNGDEFRVFGESDGLMSNNVFEIFEDPSGKIWFTSYSDKLCYFEDDQIKKYPHSILFQSYVEGDKIIEKNSFFVDSTNNISFTTRGNKTYQINQNGEIKEFYADSVSMIKSWKVVHEEWRPPFLLPLYKESKKLIIDSYHYNSVRTYDISGLTYNSLIRNYNNTYIVSIGDDVYYATNTNFLKKTLDGAILYISAPLKNSFWIGYEGGAVKYRIKENNIFPADTVLNGTPITAINRDAEGGLWFSTRGNGAFYLSPIQTRIAPVFPEINVHGIKFVNTETSLLLTTEEDVFYALENNVLKKHEIPTSLNEKIIQAFYDNVTREIYLGALHNLYRYNNGNLNKIIGDPYYALSFSNDQQDKSVWVGHTRGLANVKNDTVIYTSRTESNWAARVNDIVYGFSKGDLFLGTNEQLYIFNTNSKSYTPVLSDTTFYNISDLQKVDSFLFIGTKNVGILGYCKDSVYTFPEINNTIGSRIHKLKKEKEKIWVSTTKGIFTILFDKNNQTIELNKVPISESESSTGDIRDFTFYNNMLLLSGNDGIYAYDYQSDAMPEYMIPLYITDVNINLKSRPVSTEYKLQHNENNIKLKFIALSYLPGTNLRYSYKMSGVDKQWNTTSNTEVIYHNLAPGHYSFSVTCESGYNFQIPSAASISFTIKKPFYKTWWFIILASGIFIALVFTIQYQKIKRVRKENDFREELLDARQKALINQINPHFIFNSLNSIQLYILDNNAKLSGIYLSKFARLIRISLEVSQQNKISLSKEIEVNSLYLDMEKLRFKNRIEYEIVNNIRTNPAKVLIPPFLIQPLLENALWHGLMTKEGTKGIITLAFNKQEEQVIIKITDNGIGRKAAAELKERQNKSHKPMGISVSRRRLLLLSQQYGQNFSLSYRDLFDEQGNAAGTEATLIIPYEEIRKENN